LHYASRNGHHSIVGLLLELPEVDADARDFNRATPLAIAALYGHIEVVTQLLQTKVNINSRDEKGITPLAFASWKGRDTIVARLLAHDGDPTLTDVDGWTPLHYASRNGHLAVVRILLEHPEVDVDSRNLKGDTPLAIAAQMGHVEVPRLFIAEGFSSWNPLRSGETMRMYRLASIFELKWGILPSASSNLVSI
jgi:serine/threonine-protein phosphatase 6 regulatory ankyrin repeat subunit B